MTKKRISWYRVFESEQKVKESFPEKSVIKVMVANKFVCFTRNQDGFYAFEDSCPHQGKPLIQGSCTDHAEILCPFHQYKFDLTTGRGHGLYLKIYPVEVRPDGVFVGVEKGPWDIF